MELNQLEIEFFQKILGVELDVPVRAQLEYKGLTAEAIVVPEIAPEGYFQFSCFNVMSNQPSSVNLHMRHLFGVDPLLDLAWQEQGDVDTQLLQPQLPFQAINNTNLQAKVLYAEPRHRGTLVVNEVKVSATPSSIHEVNFLVQGLPDFKTPDKQWAAIQQVLLQEKDQLQSLVSKLGEGAELKLSPPKPTINLETRDGWMISITSDDNPARHVSTHTGTINKNDGTGFSPDELENVFLGLKNFFAFVSGAYCHPTVAIGVDQNRRTIWGQSGNFDAPTVQRPNWFRNDKHAFEGAFLEWLFPRFWRKWSDKGDEISAVIESYVHSHAMRQAGVPNDALGKSYAGLEILAGLSLCMTITGNSAGCIYRALRQNRVPRRFLKSGGTPALANLGVQLGISNWRGVELLNKVRNYVAHPLDPSNPAQIKKVHLTHVHSNPMNYVYLHDLSQYYLEYLLLAYCGYKIRAPTEVCRALLEQINR